MWMLASSQGAKDSRCAAQKVRRLAQHAHGDEQRQRDDAARRLPALDAVAGLVVGVDFDAMPALADAQYAAAGAQLPAGAQRRGQALRDPVVALGPGQRTLAPGVAGRSKTVAAGEVVQLGPGRDSFDADAVIGAAAIPEVAAQMRVVKTLLRQPVGKDDRVERAVRGARARAAFSRSRA